MNNSAAVAMDSSGNFVVAWSDFSIQAQRYDSAGRKLGNVISTGMAGIPSIAARMPALSSSPEGECLKESIPAPVSPNSITPGVSCKAR